MGHELSGSSECGILPNQGSNPCLLRLLHQQVDSLPLSHQGSPAPVICICMILLLYLFTLSIVDLQYYTNFRGTAILISGVQHSDSVFLQILP